ncbi:MAG: hypothetical protein ACAH08_02000 [Methylophilus sp.]|uniref:hypothetical protein n=1 Tax=Methylophilus sp. TaxID=29541 RepID=UPI002B98A503|nr:hypothetical protein [Methylophilus sp.]HSH86417.1 hypothetical protein [Methylophilus sp.]
MHPLFKKFLAFIALLSVISSSAWAVSPVVMADDVFMSENTLLQDVHTQNETQESPQQHQESTCNHACHFSAHILGLISHGVLHVIPVLDSGIYSFHRPHQVSHPFLQGLYRPPILL